MDGSHLVTEDAAGGLPGLIQDASVLWQCGGEWVVLDLLIDRLTSLDALLETLRGLGADDVIGLFTVNCEFSLIIRVTRDSTRMVLTSPVWAVSEYALGRAVVERLGEPEQWALFLGDPSLLQDWGIPGSDLVLMIEAFDDELPDAIRRRLEVLHLWERID